MSEQQTAPAGWLISANDATGVVYIAAPDSRHLAIGYCPHGSPHATQMLRDLAIALLPVEEEATHSLSVLRSRLYTTSTANRSKKVEQCPLSP